MKPPPTSTPEAVSGSSTAWPAGCGASCTGKHESSLPRPRRPAPTPAPSRASAIAPASAHDHARSPPLASAPAPGCRKAHCGEAVAAQCGGEAVAAWREVGLSVTAARAAGAMSGAVRGAWRTGSSGSSAPPDLSARETSGCAGQQRQMWSSNITEPTRRRVAALLDGSVKVRVRALSADACRLPPGPEFDASAVWGSVRLLAPILGANAHRPPLGCEPGRPGGSAKRAHSAQNGLGAP